MKESVGQEVIAAAEARIATRLFDAFSEIPNMIVLGPNPGPLVQRLPIISFLMLAPVDMTEKSDPSKSRFLHYNFVCAVLNDVFGIQTRGGCACAGPYGFNLLGISEEDSRRIEGELLDKVR